MNVNWNAMSRDTATLADRVKEKLRVRSKSGVEKMADFAKDNVYVAGGFTGGFFLGIASS